MGEEGKRGEKGNEKKTYRQELWPCLRLSRASCFLGHENVLPLRQTLEQLARETNVVLLRMCVCVYIYTYRCACIYRLRNRVVSNRMYLRQGNDGMCGGKKGTSGRADRRICPGSFVFDAFFFFLLRRERVLKSFGLHKCLVIIFPIF